MCELAPKRWKYWVPTGVLVHLSTRFQMFQGNASLFVALCVFAYTRLQQHIATQSTLFSSEDANISLMSQLFKYCCTLSLPSHLPEPDSCLPSSVFCGPSFLSTCNISAGPASYLYDWLTLKDTQKAPVTLHSIPHLSLSLSGSFLIFNLNAEPKLECWAKIIFLSQTGMQPAAWQRDPNWHPSIFK